MYFNFISIFAACLTISQTCYEKAIKVLKIKYLLSCVFLKYLVYCFLLMLMIKFLSLYQFVLYKPKQTGDLRGNILWIWFSFFHFVKLKLESHYAVVTHSPTLFRDNFSSPPCLWFWLFSIPEKIIQYLFLFLHDWLNLLSTVSSGSSM